MTHFSHLKAKHDLRELVTQDLGISPQQGRRASQWNCPFHGDSVICRLIVWADGFQCLGACGSQGNGLDWLQRVRKLTLPQAMKILEVDSLSALPQKSAAVSGFNPAPSATWQDRTHKLISQAVETLWGEDGEGALEYLYQRGLSSATIRSSQLGLVPGDASTWVDCFGLRVPAGIVIPWIAEEQVWSLKVRRAQGQPPYIQVAGGNAYGLYNADAITPHKPIVFCEGEFDALLLQQEGGDLICAVSLASVTASLNAHWQERLSASAAIYIAYDRDIAGQRGAQPLLQSLPHAQRVSTPQGKDITDFYRGGGDVRQWVQRLLSTGNSTGSIYG